MKKLILITSVFLSTSLWADMDKVCNLSNELNEAYSMTQHRELISENCQRNNILYARIMRAGEVTYLQSYFCRFDRNVNVIKEPLPPSIGLEERFNMNCVLYDNEPREMLIEPRY